MLNVITVKQSSLTYRAKQAAKPPVNRSHPGTAKIGYITSDFKFHQVAACTDNPARIFNQGMLLKNNPELVGRVLWVKSSHCDSVNQTQELDRFMAAVRRRGLVSQTCFENHHTASAVDNTRPGRPLMREERNINH
jgi:hypothetical protein